VQDRFAGLAIKCPACGQRIVVPASVPALEPESQTIRKDPPPAVPFIPFDLKAPRVEKSGASLGLRLAAVFLVCLAGAAVAWYFLVLLPKSSKVGKSAPASAPSQASQQTGAAPSPAEQATPATPTGTPVQSAAAPPAASSPANVAFEPLQYAHDIAPINELIDGFQYDEAKAKTEALAKDYDSSPEGRFLIKQKLLNIDALKQLRAGTIERINAGTGKVLLKDISPERKGEIVAADEKQLTVRVGDKKTELPWASLKKMEVYAIYARSGAEMDASGQAALAVFLMEGKADAKQE
jgi:hypothetical protein